VAKELAKPDKMLMVVGNSEYYIKYNVAWEVSLYNQNKICYFSIQGSVQVVLCFLIVP
jgi:hypothetical protein